MEFFLLIDKRTDVPVLSVVAGRSRECRSAGGMFRLPAVHLDDVLSLPVC
jgi:hypothetical protein